MRDVLAQHECGRQVVDVPRLARVRAEGEGVEAARLPAGVGVGSCVRWLLLLLLLLALRICSREVEVERPCGSL